MQEFAKHLSSVLVAFCWLLFINRCVGASTIQIGGLLAYNSSIGKVALKALQLAVNDVNENGDVLPNHKLVLQLFDTNCSAFQGAASALELMKAQVVAIAGPQTSEVAQFVTDMASATHIPLVSFAATDPNLTGVRRNPYFVRIVHNDDVQMQAIADIIELYGWREVVTISTNDEVGINGVDALSNFLVPNGGSLVYKAFVDTQIDSKGMAAVLGEVAQIESRVIVVNLQPYSGRLLFTMANSMQMVTSSYIWLVNEALASMLDGLASDDSLAMSTQGVVGVRSYIPPSSELDSFLQRWNPDQNGKSHDIQMNVYGFYAYDSVWMIAYAIDKFLSEGGNFAFAPRSPLPADAGGHSDLANLKILAGGSKFLQSILTTQFTGITGFVQVDSQGDLVGSWYEVVNMLGRGLRTVGYWNNGTGFSTVPPLNGSNESSPYKVAKTTVAQTMKTNLRDIIWPGGSAQVPRGWVVPKNGKPLLIGVPKKIGYKEFVDAVVDDHNDTTFHGYCIDVFEAALTYLPYSVSYNYVKFGNGTQTPNYDDLVEQVANKVFDAVVGDVTITTKRSLIVDFTQPYSASGLVVVVPVRTGGPSHAWSFMRPFTPLMWCTTGLFFLFTGVVMWILEHKKNRDFRGRPKKQIVTTLWFIFSSLFFSQREKVKSTLGRAVLIIWLFVVLIIISSYTASLTSILTVQQLLPTIQGIAGLVSSNVAIGYQAGSFVEDYLLQLNVAKDRLVPLDTLASYAQALSRGVVGAIVDELPYVQVFLSSECDYTIAGQEFTKSGWGFAFPKGSQLAIDMSTAILTLAENGQLQKIHDYWLNGQGCSADGLMVTSNELGLSTFWGLFLITGATSVFSVVVYYFRLVWQHHKAVRDGEISEEQLASRLSRGRSFLRSLVAFIEESEVPDNPVPSSLSKKKERKKERRSRKSFSPDKNDASRNSEANGIEVNSIGI